MKQGKVVALVKHAKSLIILERGGEQWLGPGGCYWRMSGAPMLETQEEFFALYDVKPETGKSYYKDFTEFPADLDYRDFAPGEEEAQLMRITATWEGVEYSAFRWRSETIFCRTEYLAPASRESGKPVQYTVRHSERVGLYICVKEGLFLAGIVFPADMGADNKQDFVDELVAVAWAADQARKLKQAAAEYADQQTMMEAT